ncbi:MAG: csiR [Polaromonas sp.]|nr:csiR [Polaromonas sp.]
MPIAAPEPDKTLADRALRLLREDILAVRLAPDTRLRVAELQKRYGLGISPLREALLRLVSEGFVVAEGQRGFAVASVSLAELEDLTRARIRLEGVLLAEAIALGDADWEAGVVAAFHRLSRASLPLDLHDLDATAHWEACHRAFHDALVAGCGSPWLLRMHAQLADHSKRYRRIRLFHSVPPSQLERSVNDEHQDLMRAVMDRDAPRAVALAQSHLNNTASAVTLFWKPGMEAAGPGETAALSIP